MKREDLSAKGLTAEQIDFVMSEYGKELNPMKAERDSYRKQLEEAQASLEGLKGIDADGLNRKIGDLTAQLQNKDAEINNIRADYAFKDKITSAIREAKGRSERAIMAMLDMDTLKASQNQDADIKSSIAALRKSESYLFTEEQPPMPRVVGPTGGQRDDGTLRSQANEALRSLIKGE